MVRKENIKWYYCGLYILVKLKGRKVDFTLMKPVDSRAANLVNELFMSANIEGSYLVESPKRTKQYDEIGRVNVHCVCLSGETTRPRRREAASITADSSKHCRRPISNFTRASVKRLTIVHVSISRVSARARVCVLDHHGSYSPAT